MRFFLYFLGCATACIIISLLSAYCLSKPTRNVQDTGVHSLTWVTGKDGTTYVIDGSAIGDETRLRKMIVAGLPGCTDLHIIYPRRAGTQSRDSAPFTSTGLINTCLEKSIRLHYQDSDGNELLPFVVTWTEWKPIEETEFHVNGKIIGKGYRAITELSSMTVPPNGFVQFVYPGKVTPCGTPESSSFDPFAVTAELERRGIGSELHHYWQFSYERSLVEKVTDWVWPASKGK